MSKREVVMDWDDKAYLRYLPPHLQERYMESVTDPQLTHLVRQISLMDVRLKSLLENLDRQVLTEEEIQADLRQDGNFPHLKEADIQRLSKFIMAYLPEGFIDHRTFKKFAGIIDRMESAQLEGRIRDADRAKKQLFDGIRSGRRDGDVWDDISKVMEERRKLSVEETKRVIDNQQILRLDQVVMLAGMLIGSFKEAVRKYVTDREIQQYILEDADREYSKQLGMGHNR